MRAPLPKTLFSRLVLVLLTGLLAAQLLAGIVLHREQIRTLYQASGLHSAQRIAEIVRLLESQGPAERERLVRVLDSRLLRIGLERSASWEPPAASSREEALELLFNRFLRRNLGDDRAIQVAVTSAAAWPPQSPQGRGQRLGHRHMMGGGMAPPPLRGGLYFLAHIQLRDGTWAQFDHRMPERTADWPWRLLLTLAILLAAVVALSILAVRWLTRPLANLAAAAEQLGRDIHSPPVAESGPLEVRRAAAAFNTMQTRLRRFIDDRTRILAAVSHDLKTPLTRLRLRAETLQDPELQRGFLRDLEEMRAMTEATLDFLRGMESKEVVQPVDIHALIESLVEDAHAQGQEVELSGDRPRPYRARPLALKRCLANLLENALKYGREVRVGVRDAPDRLRIVVADRGPGIPEERLEQVFEPFYRLEDSRNRETGGTGLGLSIARNIARAHGGELVLRNRPEQGLEAVLDLPR